jgi:serine/threonine protein phosphatase 1
MMRTLVIGDIHGGLKALQQVLERAGFSNEDRLVFIGDYVDGWNASYETIAYLIELDKHCNCVFIRGNHDELLYRFLKTGQAPKMWLEHGGKSSQMSYQERPAEAIAEHIQFLEQLQNYYVDEQNRLYVHAGFCNMHGPGHEYYPNLVYWDRTLWEMVCGLDPAIPKDSPLYPGRLKLFKEIYIGHTPVTRIGREQPVNFANVWNVDTGAAFKGSLSVLEANTKELWQSDPVWRLYPDEKGRN